ncbi:MAG: hypothetical protein MJE12_07990 [Alphaproteobacteria bacterium]|nr:hypothetical protein [Alphaproteobacteria bacterium]
MPALRLLRMAACAGMLLALTAGGVSIAQTPPADEYFVICQRLGYLPGTRPMRRCIEHQRATDLDPLNALTEFDATGSGSARPPLPPAGRPNPAPGEHSIDRLLEQSPESLLLGPDNRPAGQGIYE